jgi:chromosome segregation ATPase
MSELTPESTESTPEAGQAPQSVDQLPEWAQTQIRDLRAEAAGYRTQKNDAETRVRTAVEAEFQQQLADANAAKEAAEAQFTGSQLEIKKLRAAFGVLSDGSEELVQRADKFASLIQGSTDEEITAHAADLQSLFGSQKIRTPAVDRSPEGGDPALALNGDPLTQSLKSALGIN